MNTHMTRTTAIAPLSTIVRSVLLMGMTAMVIDHAAVGQCTSDEMGKLSAADVFAGDQLGRSVAVDTVAVAGSPNDDSGLGSAYVYEHDGRAWVQAAKLTASDGIEFNDHLGYSVATSGDVIVVGAYRPFPSNNTGVAYVYVKPVGGWGDMTETAQLTPSDGELWSNFGAAVDIDGDTIVVGAYLDDVTGVNDGAAYVYTKPVRGWTNAIENARLTASNPHDNDQFGVSVGVSGDTVIVGADREANGMFQAGMAYVFAKSGAQWTGMTETAQLTAAVPADLDRLGLSVSISGGVAVVGAWADDDLGTQAGAAYVYVKPGGQWSNMSQTAQLTAFDAAAGKHFGWSVDISADIIAVGSPANLFDGSGFGASYLFLEPASGWADATGDARITSSDHAEDDEFGLSVSVSGHKLASGARFHDTAGFSQAGAAYLHGGASDCNDDGVLDICELIAGTADDSDEDGTIDACGDGVPGDTNGDGDIDVDDLVNVILDWGTDGSGHGGDTDGSGIVDVDDLVLVILSWD